MTDNKIGVLQLTEECNQDCFHCMRDKSYEAPSYEDIENRMRFMKDEGIDEVILTGGEPLLRDDITMIIRSAQEVGIPRVHLQTNGIMLSDPKLPGDLSESGLSSILVNMQSHRKDVVERIARTKGIFDKKMKGLDNISKQKGIEKGIVFVIQEENHKDILDFVRFFNAKYPGLFYFQFSFMTRYSEKTLGMKPHVARLGSLRSHLRDALDFCRQMGIGYRIDGVPLCYIESKHWDHVSDTSDRRYGFVEEFVGSRSKYDSDHYTGKERSKSKRCISCRADGKCKGVYRYYADLFGTDELDPSLVRGDPPRIDIRVGYRCNNNCRFCVVGNMRNGINLSTDDIKERLLMGRKNGAQKAVFTGGEPTIRPDIFELVSHARKLGYDEILIITNGRLCSYDKFLSKLIESGLNSICLSLPDIEEERYDSMTCVPGGFAQFRKALANVKAQGKNLMHVSTITVISKLNFKRLPEIATFLAGMSGDYQSFFSEFIFINPEGNAWSNRDELVPRLSEAVPYVHESLDVARKRDLELSVEAIPFCHMRGYEGSIVETTMAKERVFADPERTDAEFNKTRRKIGKTKSKACASCGYDDVCEGVWNNYARMFGKHELKPVKSAGS